MPLTRPALRQLRSKGSGGAARARREVYRMRSVPVVRGVMMPDSRRRSRPARGRGGAAATRALQHGPPPIDRCQRSCRRSTGSCSSTATSSRRRLRQTWRRRKRFMADAQAPWGLDALNGAVTDPAWQTSPLVPRRDAGRMIPPPVQRAMSERAGSIVAEAAGSHAIYVSQPAAVASLISRAAVAFRHRRSYCLTSIHPGRARSAPCRVSISESRCARSAQRRCRAARSRAGGSRGRAGRWSSGGRCARCRRGRR